MDHAMKNGISCEDVSWPDMFLKRMSRSFSETKLTPAFVCINQLTICLPLLVLGTDEINHHPMWGVCSPSPIKPFPQSKLLNPQTLHLKTRNSCLWVTWGSLQLTEGSLKKKTYAMGSGFQQFPSSGVRIWEMSMCHTDEDLGWPNTSPSQFTGIWIGSDRIHMRKGGPSKELVS